MLNLLAENSINLKPGGLAANVESLSISSLIGALLRIIMIVAAVIFFFMLVLGGVSWIASGGDKTKTESARSQITAALIGLVIVFSAWAIVQLINVFFGVDLFNLTIEGVVNT